MTQEIDKERAAFEALIEAFENVVFDHARGHEPVQEVTRLREEIMEAWQASRASSVAPAGGVREIGKLRELLLDARYAMSGLLALVRGECPALIDTDRGGGGEGLKVEDCIEAIDAALSHPAVSDAQQVPQVKADSLSSGSEHIEGACGVHSGEAGVSAPSAGGSAPVAWAVFALVNGEWIAQYPIAFSEAKARENLGMYASGWKLEIRPLFDGSTDYRVEGGFL